MKRIAFFGATGGCTCACLVLALKNGYQCTALARTPEKLQKALQTTGITSQVLTSYLTIIAGDIRDQESVKKTIANAQIIVSGIGAYPKFQLSLFTPLTLDDSTICTDAASQIMQACNEVFKSERRPLFCVISTAGVQERNKPRALPLLYLPWYNWLLSDPLADKVAMEDLLVKDMSQSEQDRAFSGITIVKPSILTDGEKSVVSAVRAGTGQNPPVGYHIDRELVGAWIFNEIISTDGAEKQWKDARVTVTL